MKSEKIDVYVFPINYFLNGYINGSERSVQDIERLYFENKTIISGSVVSVSKLTG